MIARQWEYLLTFGTEFAVLACQLLVYRELAHLSGKEAFALFAIGRRTVSLVAPVFLAGLGTALPRFVARSNGANRGISERYFGAASAFVLCVALIGSVVLCSFRAFFAYLLFGSGSYAYLIVPLTFMVCGVVLHSVVYAYFRGMLQMVKANVLELVNLGLIPVGALLVYPHSMPAMFLFCGLGWIICATVALFKAPWRAIGWHPQQLRELFTYGIQRLPGDFLHLALLTLPATLLAHSAGLTYAGALAFATSFLTLQAALFGPASLVLLPRASHMVAHGNFDELRSHVIAAIKLVTLASFALAVLVEFGASRLVLAYMGQGYEDVASGLRLVALATVPYALYCILRGLIDAYHEFALNSWNNFLAIILFLAGSFLCIATKHPTLVPEVLVAALFLLGGLTLFETWKILEKLKPEVQV
jgi:O-antigen/teichoic acid export membrane protein